jgi:hypothetical protein
MNLEVQDLQLASSFGQANEILTRWLAPGSAKIGAAQFSPIAAQVDRLSRNAAGLSDRLEGLAFVGRLWSLSPWRSIPEAAEWTRKTAAHLVHDDLQPDWVVEAADWGNADARRFVSNALEVVASSIAQEIGIVLSCTEASRKSTKASSHHLDCLRRQGLTMERILAPAPSIWRRIQSHGTPSPSTAFFRFENFVGALADATWTDRQIGSPDLEALPAPLIDPAKEVTGETRENAARQMLRLLSTYRRSTPRRRDLSQGYEAASRLLSWFPSRRLPAALTPSLDELIDDLELDLVGRLELGRREGRLRELHQQLLGGAHSTPRLTHAAEVAGLEEQASIWLRTGRWLTIESHDQALAEAAALDLDPLIAEVLIDLEQLAMQRESRISETLRKAQSLARARGLSTFGRPGELVDYDPLRHVLLDDALGGDGRVAIIRQGVVRQRPTGETIVVKSTVRNAEF